MSRRLLRAPEWARVLRFVPTREAVALSATSHLLSEAVRLLLRRHVRSWRLVRTASWFGLFPSVPPRFAAARHGTMREASLTVRGLFKNTCVANVSRETGSVPASHGACPGLVRSFPM